MAFGSLVVKYLAGCALGAAVVGGFLGIKHLVQDDKPAVVEREILELPDPEKYPEPVYAEPLVEAVDVTPPAPISPDVPDACRDYLLMSKQLIECDKFPQEALASMWQGVRALEDSWRDIETMPPESKRSMAEACLQAGAAIRQSGETLGCKLP